MFDPRVALAGAMECALAYSEPTHKVGNVTFRVTTTDSGLLVTFAGTNSFLDALYDALAFLVKRAGLGDIHNGAADEWDTVKPELMRILTPAVPVTFRGHSAGAWLALYSTVWFKGLGFKVGDCYVMGCPRAGGANWATLAKACGVMIYRVVAGRDGVTMVPGGDKWFHVGDAIYLDLSGRIIPDRLAFSWNPIRILFGWLKDHASLDTYVELLARLAARPNEVLG